MNLFFVFFSTVSMKVWKCVEFLQEERPRKDEFSSKWPLVACGWYLTYFSSEVCIFPFINVYMQSKGMSSQQLGIIGALRPWIAVPTSFLLSICADYFKIHRPLMLVLLVSVNVIRLILLKSSAFWQFLIIIVVTECLGSPITIMADTAVTGCCTEEGEYGRYRLWGAVGWGGMSTIAGAVLDAYGWAASYALSLSILLPLICFTWLLWRPKEGIGLYKKLRSSELPDMVTELVSEELELGQVGTHITCPLKPEEVLIHRRVSETGKIPQENSSGGKIPEESRDESEPCVEEGVIFVRSDLSFLEKLFLIFGNSRSLIFFFTATVMGFGFGMIEGYLFIMLKDLGATDTLLGLTLTVTCLSEVPVFHFQGMMLKKLGSPDVLIDVCLAAYCVRMLGYACFGTLVKSPWWVLLLEPLHGLTFACGWGAGCEKSKALAPPGLEATQQGIFQALYFGLGYGIGNLAGGLISERWDFSSMYFVGAILVSAGFSVRLIVNRYLM